MASEARSVAGPQEGICSTASFEDLMLQSCTSGSRDSENKAVSEFGADMFVSHRQPRPRDSCRSANQIAAVLLMQAKWVNGLEIKHRPGTLLRQRHSI